MSIGSRIKEARKDMGLTQQTLAASIGVTKGAIANYENGVSVPKVELLFGLMKALNVDANYLYQDDMQNINPTTISGDGISLVETRLLDICRTLNAEGQGKLLEYADDLSQSGKYIKNNQSKMGIGPA